MSVLEIILVAFALAMDCFTVSIVNGISAKGIDRRLMAKSCVLFGVFQCMMALIGWGVAFSFAGYIKSVDHWIAFVILLLLGGKMIYDSLKHDDGECRAAGPGWRKLCIMAVATSIDALAVGATMAFAGTMNVVDVLMACGIIGVVSLLMTIAGFVFGVFVGKVKFLPMEVIGGLILIGIGVKILVEHTTSNI